MGRHGWANNQKYHRFIVLQLAIIVKNQHNPSKYYTTFSYIFMLFCETFCCHLVCYKNTYTHTQKHIRTHTHTHTRSRCSKLRCCFVPWMGHKKLQHHQGRFFFLFSFSTFFCLFLCYSVCSSEKVFLCISAPFLLPLCPLTTLWQIFKCVASFLLCLFGK